MNRLWIAVGLGMLGCSAPSMNVQRSAARGAGDTGVTVYLDQRNERDVDEKKARLLVIIAEIEKLLDNGSIGNMTINEARKRIADIVPSGYDNVANAILQYLAGHRVPTDKIPPQVVKNIRAALDGMKRGIDQYKLEDR